MEVAPSDMKRLMEGQLGTTVPQRHSLDGDEEARRVGEGGGGAGGGGGGQGEKGGVQEGGRTSATGMRITGDEKAQVFAVRYVWVGGWGCGVKACWCTGRVLHDHHHHCSCSSTAQYSTCLFLSQGSAHVGTAVVGVGGGFSTGILLLTTL